MSALLYIVFLYCSLCISAFLSSLTGCIVSFSQWEPPYCLSPIFMSLLHSGFQQIMTRELVTRLWDERIWPTQTTLDAHSWSKAKGQGQVRSLVGIWTVQEKLWAEQENWLRPTVVVSPPCGIVPCICPRGPTCISCDKLEHILVMSFLLPATGFISWTY